MKLSFKKIKIPEIANIFYFLFYDSEINCLAIWEMQGTQLR